MAKKQDILRGLCQRLQPFPTVTLIGRHWPTLETTPALGAMGSSWEGRCPLQRGNQHIYHCNVELQRIHCRQEEILAKGVIY